MKIIDRFLILRRAFLTAINPDCKSVVITRMSKDGELHKNCIFTDQKIGLDAYLKDAQSMFLDNCETSKKLNKTALLFLKGVQDQWNEDHPNDKVSFIQEVVE